METEEEHAIELAFIIRRRFRVELDKATSTYTLRIEDIQETDGAIYQCQVR